MEGLEFLVVFGAAVGASFIAVPSIHYVVDKISEYDNRRYNKKLKKKLNKDMEKNISQGKPPFEDKQLYFDFKDVYFKGDLFN